MRRSNSVPAVITVISVIPFCQFDRGSEVEK
jgi:hypothetical protein